MALKRTSSCWTGRHGLELAKQPTKDCIRLAEHVKAFTSRANLLGIHHRDELAGGAVQFCCNKLVIRRSRLYNDSP